MPDPGSPPPAQALEEIARTMRGAIGSLRAAAETLEKFPGLDADSRNRLLAVVAQESERLGDLICRLEQVAPRSAAESQAARVTVSVGALLAGLAEAGFRLGFEVEVRHQEELVPPETELDVPAAPAIAAAAAFLGELRREMAVTRLHLGVRPADHHLLFDIGWSPEPADLPRLLDWQGEAMDTPPAPPRPDAEDAERRGLRSLARDRDGEAWFILDRDGSTAHVKVLLPLAAVERTARR